MTQAWPAKSSGHGPNFGCRCWCGLASAL